MEQLSEDLQSLRELFEPLKYQPHRTLDYSYTSMESMTPCEALQSFLQAYNIDQCVQDDLDTMVFLRCDNYDFQIVIEADDQGDCYTHGVYVYVNDGDPR